MAWLHLSVRVPSFSFLLPNLPLVYSYIRMLKSPALYSVGVDYLEEDGALVQKRADIAHSAAVLLEKCQLIKYERSSGRFQSTELGRIASYYYVTYNSMMVYNQHLRSTMSSLELFRVFALSNEFKFVPVSFFP
jgi:pre-mRNA-splicing helicase BRR2